AGRVRERFAGFSPREQRALAKIALAAMPKGKIFPAAGEQCLGRLEAFMRSTPPAIANGYRFLIRAIEAEAALHHLRPLERLSDEEALELLERWRKSDYLHRTLLRLLTAPLKAAHFHSPEMYSAVGCRYESFAAAHSERPRYLSERVTTG